MDRIPAVQGVGNLIVFIQEMIDIWNAAEGIPCSVAPERGETNAAMVFGFAAHTVELSRAIIALYKVDCEFAALRLIRGAMECAITAAWLAHEPEGTARVLFTGAKDLQTVLTELKSGGRIPEIGRLLKANATDIATFEKDGVREVSISDRFNALVGGGQYYTEYRMASALCHPTHPLAEAYVHQHSEGIKLLPRGDYPSAEQWLGQHACMLVIAQIAYESIQIDQSRLPVLIDHAHRVGIEGTTALKKEFHRSAKGAAGLPPDE